MRDGFTLTKDFVQQRFCPTNNLVERSSECIFRQWKSSNLGKHLHFKATLRSNVFLVSRLLIFNFLINSKPGSCEYLVSITAPKRAPCLPIFLSRLYWTTRKYTKRFYKHCSSQPKAVWKVNLSVFIWGACCNECRLWVTQSISYQLSVVPCIICESPLRGKWTFKVFRAVVNWNTESL